MTGQDRAPRDDCPARGLAEDAPHSTLEVTTVRSTEELMGLEHEWSALHDETADTSVFMSWEWQSAWWRHYGRPGSLRLVVVREARRLVGILPLHLRRERIRLGLEATVLRPVGTGGDTQPDDLGPLLAAGRGSEVGAAMARHLMQDRREWDVLLVTDLPAGSAFAGLLQEAASRAHLSTGSGVSATIAYTELPPTWDDYLASVSRKRRWRLRNTRRKVERLEAARFFVWDDGARLDVAVDRLAELHRLRWEAAGRPHSFSSPEYVSFHRQVIKSCTARGWVRLYCLAVAGQLEAIYYCYTFRGAVYLMQGGFDPSLARLRPGHALLGHALEHAVGTGARVFDFLRGRHRYKDELATAWRETRFVEVRRMTPGGFAWRVLRLWLPALKRASARALATVLPGRPERPPDRPSRRVSPRPLRGRTRPRPRPDETAGSCR